LRVPIRRPPGGEPPEDVVLRPQRAKVIGGADGDRVRVDARGDDGVPRGPGVTRGGDHDEARAPCDLDRRSERVRAIRTAGIRTEREVDDPDVVGGPVRDDPLDAAYER